VQPRYLPIHRVHDTNTLINASSKTYFHWRMNDDVVFLQSDCDYELLDLGQSSRCSLGPRLSCTAVQAILTRSGQDDISVCMHARIFVDYLLMLVVT